MQATEAANRISHRFLSAARGPANSGVGRHLETRGVVQCHMPELPVFWC